VERVQKALEVPADNKWGKATDFRAIMMRDASRAHAGWPHNVAASIDVRTVQRIIDTTPDGDWGPNSQRALVSWIKGFQHLLGVTPDGAWGNDTDAEFIRLRHKWLNNF
jgi:hypothetical protein